MEVVSGSDATPRLREGIGGVGKEWGKSDAVEAVLGEDEMIVKTSGAT
jgi:hypothetical protein